jgi:hypothetical protein
MNTETWNKNVIAFHTNAGQPNPEIAQSTEIQEYT